MRSWELEGLKRMKYISYEVASQTSIPAAIADYRVDGGRRICDGTFYIS